MDDLKPYLDLDMNIKIRKALAAITVFIRARTEREAIENLEKAIDYLNSIREGFIVRKKMR